MSSSRALAEHYLRLCYHQALTRREREAPAASRLPSVQRQIDWRPTIESAPMAVVARSVAEARQIPETSDFLLVAIRTLSSERNHSWLNEWLRIWTQFHDPLREWSILHL